MAVNERLCNRRLKEKFKIIQLINIYDLSEIVNEWDKDLFYEMLEKQISKIPAYDENYPWGW